MRSIAAVHLSAFSITYLFRLSLSVHINADLNPLHLYRQLEKPSCRTPSWTSSAQWTCPRPPPSVLPASLVSLKSPSLLVYRMAKILSETKTKAKTRILRTRANKMTFTWGTWTLDSASSWTVSSRSYRLLQFRATTSPVPSAVWKVDLPPWAGMW